MKLSSPCILRVITSSFSGVETNKFVFINSFLDNCISPLTSFTVMLIFLNIFLNFVVISATSAFIGATYTILRDLVRCLGVSFIALAITSKATFVFPADVGAESNIFSFVLYAVLKIIDCI
eukprot:NODE_3_length_80033_cov_0.932970.p68 type:complete len:121 gc:universal NODE_3_length_80033_cov_0.932970:33120-33482(+)